MVCMAGLQVFIVRFFFQGARKGIEIVGSSRLSMLTCGQDMYNLRELCKKLSYIYSGLFNSIDHDFPNALVRTCLAECSFPMSVLHGVLQYNVMIQYQPYSFFERESPSRCKTRAAEGVIPERLLEQSS